MTTTTKFPMPSVGGTQAVQPPPPLPPAEADLIVCLELALAQLGLYAEPADSATHAIIAECRAAIAEATRSSGKR